MNLYYPYQFDGRGRTRDASEEEFIRGLIEQVLFTAPGERVMRPDFGSGLHQMVFAPNSVELAATLQMLVQASLQQSLSNLITVNAVEVEAEDAILRVSVSYTIRRSNTPKTDEFKRGVIAS
jgi:phage baseplate assembly protein W